MAVRFTAASSQKLANSTAPVTTWPFTIGIWFNFPTISAYRGIWALLDTAGSSNYFSMYLDTGNTITFATENGGTWIPDQTATAIVANAWYFAVYRVISATNRRMSILHPFAAPEHVQGTTSVTPAGIDSVTLGAVEADTGVYMEGGLAEYWMANVDIQADGGALLGSTLRQLAYGGPFSMPHIAASIVDYQSLRSGVDSSQDKLGEIYSGGAGRQIWAKTGSPIVGPHPPLPYWYVKPGQAKRALVV